MENIIRNSKTITRLELERLYSIYADNFPDDKQEMNHWIDEIITEPDVLYSMFYDNDKLAGYIIIYLRETENYIREFEIAKEYQNNGTTFKDMIKETIHYTNTDNMFTGIILPNNEEAKGVFRRIGAIAVDGKYSVPADRLIKLLDKSSREDFAKQKPNVERARQIIDKRFNKK